MQPLTGKRIAIYARYSSDKQNPKSVDDQFRICREHIERNGGVVDDDLVFMDAAISGKSNVRPGFQALQEACRARRVDVVVTESTDRIGRDFANNAVSAKQFQTWGARLIAISDGVDTAQQGSKYIYALKSLIGEEYLEALGKKTKRGMDGRHAAGKATGGKTYGYDTVPAADGGKVAVINKLEAAVVRRVFELYVSGHSIRSIAAQLNRGAHKPPRTGLWNNMTVRAMLANEKYTGLVTFNRYAWSRDSETGKRSYVENPRSEWSRVQRDELVIIDPEIWHAASMRRRAVAKTFKEGKRKTSTYPLSGLLACGVCGAAMTINGGSAAARYYSCSANRSGRGCTNKGSIAEPRLRTWFFETFRDAAGETRTLTAIREAWAKGVGAQGRAMREELEQRRTALTTTTNQISRLLDFIADGNDSPATTAKIKEKEDHAELQRAAIAKLERATVSVPRIPSVDQVRAFLAALPQAVTKDPVKVREAVRAMLVGSVECFPPERNGDMRVRFELDPEAVAKTAAPDHEAAVFSFASCGGLLLAKEKRWVIDRVCPK